MESGESGSGETFATRLISPHRTLHYQVCPAFAIGPKLNQVLQVQTRYIRLQTAYMAGLGYRRQE